MKETGFFKVNTIEMFAELAKEVNREIWMMDEYHFKKYVS